MVIYPKKFVKEMKTFYDETSQEKKDLLIKKIQEFHQKLKSIQPVDLKKELKIQFIHPEFQAELLESYLEFKDNAKHHREKKD